MLDPSKTPAFLHQSYQVMTTCRHFVLAVESPTLGELCTNLICSQYIIVIRNHLYCIAYRNCYTAIDKHHIL